MLAQSFADGAADRGISRGLANMAAENRSRRLVEKSAAVLLLLLLHGALFLLFNPTVNTGVRPGEREIVLSLVRLARKKLELAPMAPKFETPNYPSAIPGASPLRTVSSIAPAIPSRPDLAGIGRSLFGCGLGDTENLRAGERANCDHLALRSPLPGAAEIGMPRKSRSQQHARWEAELARKNAPVRIPCSFVMLDPTGKAPTPMINPFCAMAKAISGLRKDDFGGYASASEDYGN